MFLTENHTCTNDLGTSFSQGVLILMHHQILITLGLPEQREGQARAPGPPELHGKL